MVSFFHGTVSFLKKIFGTANDRLVKKMRTEVSQINNLESRYSVLSDEDLRNETVKFKEEIANGATLDSIAYRAFAVVREAAKRTLGQRHFDEQMIGGLALHRGMIAEMRTGEGKTLVGTLPGYLNALSGKGVHIVTVNDYLAKRDSEWVGRVFKFLGLTVGCVTSNMPSEMKKEAYLCDITYATNNELGFDYLRDNMRYSFSEKTQRELNYAIVDEVDSILIDESRTPLIMSGPVEQNTSLYTYANKIVETLSENDYEKDEKNKSVHLTDSAINKIEDFLKKYKMIDKESTLFDFDNIKLVHYINQSLKARALFKKDVDYIVKDGRLLIVDEFTGRVMDGRRYSDGLHQALEAKEGLVVQNENQTLASITFQNYFRMYKKLSGMTGTAMTEAGELKDIYNLDVLAIPTHNKSHRTDHHDEIYGTKQEKYDAILKDIIQKHEKGQPILIGTISIEKSEEISLILKKTGIKHNVLNAKQHEREAYIIAQAGRFGAITIATNMAGRGTDIMLGGNPEMMAHELGIDILSDSEKFEEIKALVSDEKQKVIESGGLYVLGTERHESRRIDNQLRGRSGRQGDPGETKFFMSLDDDLMRIFASEKMTSLLRTLGLKNGEAIFHPMINRAIEKAQSKVEAHHYEIRKNLLRFDNVMNEQRKVIYEHRNSIMESANVFESFSESLQDLVNDLVAQFIPKDSFRDQWNLQALAKRVKHIFNLELDTENIMNSDVTEEVIISNIIKDAEQVYQGKIKKYTPQIMKEASRYMLLHVLDHLWKDHLHTLDQLKHGIHLRAYGQKDPLNEYKREAFMFFEMMMAKLQELFIQTVLRFDVDQDHFESQMSKLALEARAGMSETREDPAFSRYNPLGTAVETKLSPIQNHIPPEQRDPKDPETWGKIKRNDLCPCGSGKKYKQCHGSLV